MTEIPDPIVNLKKYILEFEFDESDFDDIDYDESYFDDDYPDHNLKICRCCGKRALAFSKFSLKERLRKTLNPGIQNILTVPKLEELNSEALEIIEWCVDYLLYQKEIMDVGIKTRTYHNLSSFIINYLKIKSSVLKYWILCYLEHLNIAVHGSGIRACWFNSDPSNPYLNRVLSEERKNKIEIAI
jgi:hypothetical protein